MGNEWMSIGTREIGKIVHLDIFETYLAYKYWKFSNWINFVCGNVILQEFYIFLLGLVGSCYTSIRFNEILWYNKLNFVNIQTFLSYSSCFELQKIGEKSRMRIKDS